MSDHISDPHDPQTQAPGPMPAPPQPASPPSAAGGRTPNRARRVAAATAVAAGVALTGAIAVSARDSNDTADTTDTATAMTDAASDPVTDPVTDPEIATSTDGLPTLDAAGGGQVLRAGMPTGEMPDGEFGQHGGPPPGDWAGEDATSARPAMPDAGGQLGAPDAASQSS